MASNSPTVVDHAAAVLIDRYESLAAQRTSVRKAKACPRPRNQSNAMPWSSGATWPRKNGSIRANFLFERAIDLRGAVVRILRRRRRNVHLRARRRVDETFPRM